MALRRRGMAGAVRIRLLARVVAQRGGKKPHIVRLFFARQERSMILNSGEPLLLMRNQPEIIATDQHKENGHRKRDSKRQRGYHTL